MWFNPVQKADDEFDDEEDEEEKEEPDEPEPENGPKLLTSVAEDASESYITLLIHFLSSSQLSMVCQHGLPSYPLM